MIPMDVHALVLAAGSSSRLGRPKQLVEWNGQSLLQRAVAIAREAGATSITVITGANEEAMCAELADENVCIVHNSDWQEGMGASIRCGVAALVEAREPFGILFLVCDQLRVTADHLRAMIRAFHEGSAIVASGYAGTAGVPALFSSTYRAELSALEGAHGAKQVLARHREAVHVVPLPGGEIEVDTPADLARTTPRR